MGWEHPSASWSATALENPSATAMDLP
jgi:hypothetical protein